MLNFDKKGQGELPSIKTIILIVVIGVFFITWLVLLLNFNNYSIDEREVVRDQIISKVTDGKCFSNEIGVIDSGELNQNNLDECFSNLDGNYIGYLSLETNSGEVISDTSHYINGNQEDFERFASQCGVSDSHLCHQVYYPMIYDDTPVLMNLLVITSY